MSPAGLLCLLVVPSAAKLWTKVRRPDKYLLMKEILIMNMVSDLVGAAQTILATGIP